MTKLKKISLGAIVAILIGGLGYYWNFRSNFSIANSAVFSAPIYRITAEVPGTVESLPITVHDTLAPQSIVAKLKMDSLTAGMSQATARSTESTADIAHAEAQLNSIAAKENVARAHLEQCAMRVEMAKERVTRVEKSGQANAPQTAPELAGETALSIAQTNLKMAETDQKLAQFALESVTAEVEATKAVVKKTSAISEFINEGQKLASADLSNGDLKSPVAGTLGSIDVAIGDRVDLGQSVATVVGEDLSINALFNPNEAVRLTTGQPCQIVAGTPWSRVKLDGVINTIAPASENQLNASRKNLVPVTITIPAIPPGMKVIPGMSAKVVVALEGK